MASLRVLLLEDDPAIARTVAYALEREGHTTHSLLLRDARSQWSSGGFDLLVLDVGLPDGGGLDLCREGARCGQHPVLMLSAAARAGPRARPGAGRRRLPGQTFQPARTAARARPAAPRRNPVAQAPAPTAFCDDRSGQRILLPTSLCRSRGARISPCCRACWRARAASTRATPCCLPPGT